MSVATSPILTPTYATSSIKRPRRGKDEMQALRDVLFEIVREQHPITCRGCFYQAVSRGLIEKTETQYRSTVCRLLTEMRRAKRIPYRWITDDTRWVHKSISKDIDPGLRWPIHFKRVAVTPEQITAWNLPTRPTKKTDSRSKGFGDESIELDAIPPLTLRDLVREGIEQHIDPYCLQQTRRIEAQERGALGWVIGDFLGGAA